MVLSARTRSAQARFDDVGRGTADTCQASTVVDDPYITGNVTGAVRE